MPVRLTQAGSFILKLFLSLLAVFVFVYFGLKVPEFQRSAEPIAWDAVAGKNLSAGTVIDPLNSTALGNIEFASADDLFSGSFFVADQDMGFDTREVNTAGPCDGAGLRYIKTDCPNCVIAEIESQDGEAPTVYWMKQAIGEAEVSGTIYRDCVANNDDGTVTVPMLSFSSDTLALANTAPGTPGTPASVPSPIPLVDGHKRISAMSLGDWSIAVDSVEDSNKALLAMEAKLLVEGWVRTATGEAPPLEYVEQRVYKRSPTELCVVSLTQEEDEFQLVTMTNAK
ncbi:MAG: hypothetical protein ACI9JM_003131 [Halioglobus sp.]